MVAVGWVRRSCVIIFFLVNLVAAYDYNYCGAPLELKATETNLKLEFVQLITRHGDRTSLTQLPGDHTAWQCNITTYTSLANIQVDESSPRIYRKNYLPGRQPAPGNCYQGQLTEKGLRQHYELGVNLRSLYVDQYKFLPPTMNKTLICIRSTDYPRTFASAEGNNLGLYPAPKDPTLLPIIDIYTMDQKLENMYPNSNLCPRAAQITAQLLTQPEYVAWVKANIPLQQKIAKILGMPLQSLPDWSGLLDAFSVMTCYGQSYPGMDQATINQIMVNANWQWNYQLNSSELVRLLIGSFTTELVRNIQDKISGSLALPPYMVFSGHDTTLGPLLASLQAYDGQWPPYASHAEIELWSDAGKQYFVQVKYQGEPLHLPLCSSTMCPYSEFLQLVNPIISINYPQACQAR